MASGSWQMPMVIPQKSQRWRARFTVDFHMANGHKVKPQESTFENLKLFSKIHHPLKKCFVDRFSGKKMFWSIIHM
jgi:hypothetical protein